MTHWPPTADELVEEQARLALAPADPWAPEPTCRIGGCFVCFPRGAHGVGRAGDRAWAAAAVGRSVALVEGAAGAPYEPGLLALREGALLERAVRALPEAPDALLVNATGRDHPRRAGLAVHLGAVLDLATVGVTHRTLLARGGWPPDTPGARSPLLLDGEQVGWWLRTRVGARPLAVHAGWRTDPDTAAALVLSSASRARTRSRSAVHAAQHGGHGRSPASSICETRGARRATPPPRPPTPRRLGSTERRPP